MSEVIDVRGRHLLRLADFTSAEILYLLDLAAELKAAKRWPRSEIVDLARSIANETGARPRCLEAGRGSDAQAPAAGRDGPGRDALPPASQRRHPGRS